MANPTIDIKSSGPTPTPITLAQGEDVTFQMVDWPVEVTIDFGTASPFSLTEHSFTLNGGDPQQAVLPKRVLESASGKYPYTVTPTKRDRMDPEPTSTPSGEIDVSPGW